MCRSLICFVTFRWHPWRCFRSSSTPVSCPETRPLSSLQSLYIILTNDISNLTGSPSLNPFPPSHFLSFQVWFGCLWHTGEVPRLVPGQSEHWGGSQGQTQDQEPSVGGLPNQGPQPQNPLFFTWWTTGNTQQIWYTALLWSSHSPVLLSSTAHCGFFFPAFKLLIVALSTIFPVCREAWAASSAGIISVLWCRFSPASTDPRRSQCKRTRVSWEHRWWLCQQLLPDSELGRYNETFADPC